MTGPFEARRLTPTGARAAMAVTGEHRMSLKEIRPALFVDRDGTLIKDVGYIKDPNDVELIPETTNAIRRMNYELWPVIVVTNQSGIARGMLGVEDYEAVRARLDDKLAERGAYINAHYYCPHHPDFSGPCACRKPGTLLFDRAIADHAINPVLSVFVGDRWRDIAPALHYGARGILVPGPSTPPEELAMAQEQAEVARTLAEAVHHILQV
jgi:D-glycero-D-manno-heptose 1,7-bisphosphate phosphatase